MTRTVFLAVLCLCFIAPPAQAQSPVETTRAYRQAHEAEILQEFAALLRIPNVATDSASIWANAEHIRDAFAERDVAMDLIHVPGAPPVVTGRIDRPGAERTIGIYVHYDGQPVDTANWTHSPWEPTLYRAAMPAGGEPIAFPDAGETVDPEARLYARSAGDDKAPIVALLAVLDAFAANDLAPQSNVVFFFDGEEERGSPHLKPLLEQHRDRFADIDLWLYCDGPTHQSGQPQIVYGVRGVTGLEVTVYGAAASLHSGHYGNWAPVPGTMLAELLASMKSSDGTIHIDGFYDTVAPLGEAEREALEGLPDVDEKLKHELQLARTEGDTASLNERLLLPSLTVRGLKSGNVGAKARNVIPNTATATLGVRLVDGNEPGDMLDRVEAHIRAQGYHIVRDEPSPDIRRTHPKVAKVTRGPGYPAFRTEMDLPMAQWVVAAAERAAGQEVLQVPTLGGTLPLAPFDQVLGIPGLIVPVANYDNNQHAPNENLRIGNLWYAIDLYAALLGGE